MPVRWIEQFVDPRRLTNAIREIPRYWHDWRRYGALADAEPLKIRESYPQLHDRVRFTSIDAHYFYANGWAIRRIIAERPRLHVDIGSQTMFVNLLAASLPVVFADYRPLVAGIGGLNSIGASILALPFRDGSIRSLSCLHVAEHIGLGRYGDPLDPLGTKKTAAELTRVLAPRGTLLFAVPVGRERVCFNAHRVHAPATIREYFGPLDLVEFSAVDDRGHYIPHADIAEFASADYACGLFALRKREE